VRRYWDSSALVDALEDSRIEALASEEEQFTRSHALAEVFSTITGGRLGYKYHAEDAAALIAELTASMNFVELDPKEVQTALDIAHKRGVRGGQIHDLLHATAAKKARVEVLLTDNITDFTNLADGLRVAPP
jgi:predicted nucleic acid-binding protein